MLYKTILKVILIVSLKQTATFNSRYSHPLLDMYNKYIMVYFCLLHVAGQTLVLE
jgi:hypothetical protein